MVKDRVGRTQRTILLLVAWLLGLGATTELSTTMSRAEADTRATAADGSEPSEWQAPGLVEPGSGEIKIASPITARIADVPVKPDDKVFAGQLLVALDDQDARARVAGAEAKIALDKRVRNDAGASGRVNQRRKAEDAVADAERAVVEARSVLDQATAGRRNGGSSDAAVVAARSALSRAQDRLAQQQAALEKLEAQTTMPLPTESEGQLNIARAKLWEAQAVLDKTTIRAPIAGSVLKVNVKAGELAIQSSAEPLVILGDLSVLRVRAEVDEQDFAKVKIDQSVSVQTADFPQREFAGKVSSIAPIVEDGDVNLRGGRYSTNTQVVKVLIGLTDFGQLAVGMRVNVFFRPNNAAPGQDQ
jgi:HlyD family secretion protein